jgi:hypothetical protein
MARVNLLDTTYRPPSHAEQRLFNALRVTEKGDSAVDSLCLMR